ncbi:SDR family NAD(P)-dependent oxidoreductase [Aestuariivirga sp.]|uniref:SDR family NAD(P)-dependent oxidoreductase n=1 Tax=Aestuariivirga sp. TaxID=2650926 RepID=UPI00391B21F7
MREVSANWLESQFSCEGKRVLVTGASRGIGQELAVAFAHAGADLVIASRKLTSLDQTAERIHQAGRKAERVSYDQSRVEDIRKAFSRLGRIDVLVNNAGVEEVRPSLDVDESLWTKIVDTNLKGAFFVAQSIAGGMAQAGGGAIINLASLTSFVGVPTAAPYGASKSGVLGLTRALATEWGASGIRVNAIAPGYFRTGMTEVFYENTAWVERMTTAVPLGRLGALEDLAGAAVFLASPASRYITGQCLVIDGGYLAAI